MFLRDTKFTRMHAIFHNANYVRSLSLISTLCVCLRQFSFRSGSQCYKTAKHTTTGWHRYKDSTTILIHVTRTSRSMRSFTCGSEGYTPNTTVGSLPLANNVKHSPSYNILCTMHAHTHIYTLHHTMTALR